MQLVEGAGLIAASVRTACPAPVYRPTDLDGALALLAREEVAPVVVAGGTDLCAQFNAGVQPSALLALDRIAVLQEVVAADGALRIGAGVTHGAGCVHPLVTALIPGFGTAWAQIANVRVRFWATLGGNLMARRTRYEMALLLTALDAWAVFVAADGAEVRLRPADIWAGMAPVRGLLLRVEVPLRGRVRFAYDRSLRPVMTLAVRRDEAGCGAAVATEMLWPVALAADGDADAALAALPADFADAASSNWYLRRAGAVLLRRAMAKVSDDA